MKKTTLSTIAILLALLFTPTNTIANDYKGHPLQSGIEEAISRGILIPKNKNIFPNKNITRGEFAAMISRTLQLTKTGDNPFSDITTEHPLYEEINKAFHANLINGYNEDTFNPNKEITREEMAVMLERMLSEFNVNFSGSIKLFKDKDDIFYLSSVIKNSNIGIIGGFPDGTFRPKNYTTVAEATAFIIRSINLLEKNNKLGNIENEIKDEIENEEFLFINTKIENTNEPQNIIATTKSYTLIYDETLNNIITYVSEFTELQVLEILGNKVKIKIAGKVGYVKSEQVIISNNSTNRSYYTNINGNLIHVIFYNNKYSSYIFGQSPHYIENGEKVFSWDGINLNGFANYQYFNNLPLRTKTSYSGEELDFYIKKISPDSPLIGLGSVFVEAANLHDINATYLLANAIQESGWGKSEIAETKNNLFGIRAEDDDPKNKALHFNTKEESIYYAANMISNNYINPNGVFYNGAFLGNKSKGLNMRYASDPYWGQKISGIMYRIDQLLGKKDLNRYILAQTTNETKIHIEPNQNSEIKSITYPIGHFVSITDIIKNEQGVWYKITSDFKNDNNSYIKREDVKIIPPILDKQ